MSYSIKHNSQFQKFYINVNGREAFLKYERTGEGVLDFKMLFVPKNLRGVGIAEKVLKKAIGYAEKYNLKVKTSCTYINSFLEENPEYKAIISGRPDMHSWVLHYN
jgi:predicted GNAT family acetyltransferase